MQWSMVGVLAWTLAAGAGTPGATPSSTPKATEEAANEAASGLKPLAAWPRMSRVEFACMLAQAGAEVDPKWACDAPAVPNGDPCKDTDHYYAGPEFPASLLAHLPVPTTSVSLSWEHGSLQQVSLHLAPGVDAVAARAALPPTPLPANIIVVDVQECSRDHLCASLTGFDHMGAGEVDCEN